MRVGLLLCLVGGVASGQPADAPMQLHLELNQLRADKEAISLATPLTLTFVGLGALTGGALFDAATASARRSGGISAVGALSYVITSLTLVPGFCGILAKLAERWMLDGHIRHLEHQLALVPG